MEAATLQRRTALERANEIRSFRAELKRELRLEQDAQARVARLILEPPATMASMRVEDLLVACRMIGTAKCSRMLVRAGILGPRTLGETTQRQRVALARELAPERFEL